MSMKNSSDNIGDPRHSSL